MTRRSAARFLSDIANGDLTRRCPINQRGPTGHDGHRRKHALRSADNLGMDEVGSPFAVLAACLDARWSDVPPDVDWSGLASFARRCGVSGMLLHALQRADREIPTHASLALQEHATQIASWNDHSFRSLKPVAAALAEAEIDVLLLKGAALELTTYRTPGLRPMSDIDMMVRQEDLPRVRRVLERTGCRPGAPLLRADFFPRYYYETEYVTGDEHALRLDLHVRPFRPLRYSQCVPAALFWEDAVPVNVDGVPLKVPSCEHMLLHLAVHAAVHGAGRFLWLYDIHHFIRANGASLNWAALLETARQCKLTLPLRVALQRVEALFGASVPAAVVARLRRQPVGLRDRLALWHAPRDDAHPVGHLLVDLMCTNGLRFRLGYAAAVLLPQREHLATIYPRRHRGWTICAHGSRVLRTFRRAAGYSVAEA